MTKSLPLPLLRLPKLAFLSNSIFSRKIVAHEIDIPCALLPSSSSSLFFSSAFSVFLVASLLGALAPAKSYAAGRAASPAPVDIVYTVRNGDTLSAISEIYLRQASSWVKLQQLNNVVDPMHLQPGSKLRIPMALLKQTKTSAEAVWVQGDVNTINPAGAVLSKLTLGDRLHMGDMVKTGPKSSITIRFIDDSRLLVTENSKIALASLMDYGKSGMAETKVDLYEGGSTSQVSKQKGAAAKYEVKTPALNLAVRGTYFRVKVEEGSGLTRTEVSEGRVGAVGEKGKGREVALNAGVGLVAEPGKPLGKPVRLLTGPVFDKTDWVVDQLPFDIEWHAMPEAQEFRGQLLAVNAATGMGDRLVFDGVFKDNHATWADLPDGKYILRLRAIDSAGLEGTDAKLALTINAGMRPPVIQLPLNQDNVEGEKVLFRWIDTPTAKSYRFQVAEKEDFSQLLANLPNLPQRMPGIKLALPPGQYYWRVASVNEKGEQGPYSEVQQFTLVKSVAKSTP